MTRDVTEHLQYDETTAIPLDLAAPIYCQGCRAQVYTLRAVPAERYGDYTIRLMCDACRAAQDTRRAAQKEYRESKTPVLNLDTDGDLDDLLDSLPKVDPDFLDKMIADGPKIDELLDILKRG